MGATETRPSLVDLVPVETLERVARMFELTAGVPMVFTDAGGTAVTELHDPLRYCGTLVSCPGVASLCLRRRKWDEPEPTIEEKIREKHADETPVQHRCVGGFVDAAVPIVVEGQIVGYSVFARSRTQPPDIGEFRALAEQRGMEPEVGEEVARRTLVMSEEQVGHVAEFLQVITNLVARAAYDTIRAQQVLELEQLRDSLVHMIVHDLRTPLTGIIGSLQTVLDGEYDPELTQEFVPLALSSSETLLEMVNTLLDINKMESGEVKLTREQVDFAEIAETAAAQVRGLMSERGHELVVQVPPECPLAEMDRDLVRRTVVNLLGNAAKFTPDGGRITLSAHCSEDGLTFSIADTGPGIPAEDQERIFEKFGQVETRQTGRKHSTGLGLTFCKMVAEAHGGRIWVESELGKGSTFWVWIPG